ncbi:MAG: DNA-3-methyladenine glycosylase [Daejeonella sp.]|uniref:DNA-3-methyladenine glycosylase n=1 Tax=Daejeonella sp. TaxID=2805397 RepID=UPI003C776182
MNNKLSLDFYSQADVVSVARQLLGKHLYSKIGGKITGGIIVETEAYRGPDDRGSHAYMDKKTPRTEMMYQAGGVAYMYICYGIHDMLNIVTGTEGMSHAALIRAIEPIEGLDVMRNRRAIFDDDKRLCQGPGALAKAMGLSKLHNGTDLQGDTIWLTDEGLSYSDLEVMAGARVGMNFEGPYKTIPWRFYVKGNAHVSRPRI